jgi:hypothetical protein
MLNLFYFKAYFISPLIPSMRAASVAFYSTQPSVMLHVSDRLILLKSEAKLRKLMA